MKRKFTFLIAAAMMLLTMMATTGRMWGQSYTVATSISVGDVVLLVRSDVTAELNGFTTSGTLYGISADVTNSTPAGLCPLTVVAGSQNEKFAFKTSDNKYLSWSSGNTLTTSDEINDNSSWTVSISAYGTHPATISNVNTSARQIKYNSSSPRFACYTSGQQTVALFKQSGPTKLSTPTNFAATPGNAQATFTWTAVEHASSYTISYTPNSGAEQTVASITGTSKTIEGLTNGTEYTCKIKAVGDGENYSDSDYSSTITVTPTAATYYTITIDDGIENGSVEASASSATEGTSITLTPTADAGYDFGVWNVYKTGDQTTTVTVNNNAFNMPDYDVTVSATFTAMPVYTVSCTTPANGTLSVSPTSGYNGVEVTITATPNSGYELATLTATDDEGEITITDNKFNIRNSNVTVAATFTPVIVYEWVLTDISDLTAEDVFVIVGTKSDNSTYAMPNNGGTSAPTATSISIVNNKISGAVNDNLKWNVSGNSTDGYTFYPNGSTTTWLYCTDANNGVKVGTGNAKAFAYEEVTTSGKEGNYLTISPSSTKRYVCIYNTQDWRCYASGSIVKTNTTFYKRVIPAAVETPVISLASGTYNTNQSVTITCATDGATIYYTTDGTTPTSSSTQYTEVVSITQTTTLKAIAIKGDDSSNVASATYTMKCATPTFSPVAGAYTSVQNVTISSTSPEVSIYYTLDGTTPTSSSTLYNGAINVGETKTIKAIAIKNNWTDSEIATAAYTIELPLTTMDEIYAKALEYNTTGGPVNITFGDWVITGVNGSTAYLTDGTKGCIIYQSGHGFSVGNILSGTAACKVKTYYDAPELYNLTSATSGLEVNTGGTITPTTTTIAALSAVNTGSVFTLRDLTYTYSTDMLSDGTYEIKLKDNLYDFSSKVEDGGKYHVTGVFVLYGEQKQIYPRSEEDIVLAADMSATDFSGLTAFTYLVDNGPSAAQHIELYGEDFAGNLTVTASGDYEVSTDNTTYSESVVVAHDEGDIAEDLYVRLKAGLATGEHNGTLTFEADNLTTQVVDLEGMVSATQAYAILINTPIANGSVTADVSVAVAGDTITLTATPDECYQFVEWVTEPDNLTWTSANQFTMPAEDVLISATFSQITYTVQYSINGNVEDDLEESVGCGEEASLWDNDEVAILGVTLPSGFSLLGWSTTEGGTETVASFEPEADATLYAVLIPTGFVVGYELITSASQITEGKYLIAAFKSTTLPNPVKYYIATGTTGSGDMNVTENSFSPTDNVFAEVPTGGVEFEFTGNNINGFIISYDTLSLGYTSYANRKLAMGDYSAYKWKFSDLAGGLSTGALYMTCNYNNKTYTVSENATVGNGVIRGYASSTAYRGFYLFKKAETSPISNVTEITEPEASMSTNIPENTCVVVNDGSVLTFTGENNGNASNLIIQEGGQLIHANAVEATIQKGISGYNSKSGDGWYLIASPADGVSTSGLITDPVTSYDLYKYDEPSGWWYSNHGEASPFNTLERGKGYLYANANNIDLDFAGLMIGTDDEVTKTLSFACTEYPELKGYNLMGNPFTCNLGEGDITLGGEAVTSVLLLNNDADYQTCNFMDGGVIKPGQGFFIQATDGDKLELKFNPSSTKDANEIGLISIEAGNESYIDKAYIQFNGGNTLRKMTFSGDKSQVYVMHHYEDYAAATIYSTSGSMPVNFEAAREGFYTITIEAKDLDLEYLTLIDNFTGEEIDLLVEPSYTFKANSDEPASRFTLIFRKTFFGTDEINVENDIFAYQNGSDIIVNGDGTLQVFDVMGRLVMTTNVNGIETINVKSQGVYIFRLNGMTQKIVVR